MDGCVYKSSLWEILYCLLQGNVCVFSCLEFKGWIQTQLKGQWITWDKQLAFKREITESLYYVSLLKLQVLFEAYQLHKCRAPSPTVQLSWVGCSQHCSSDPRSNTICCHGSPSPPPVLSVLKALQNFPSFLEAVFVDSWPLELSGKSFVL